MNVAAVPGAHTTATFPEVGAPTLQRVTTYWTRGRCEDAARNAVPGTFPRRPPPQGQTRTDFKEETKMKENECKKCIYRQSEQSMSRKVNAFNAAFQKVSGFAALAECVADAVDDIEIAINDQNWRRYEKLVELSYLLCEDMEHLKEYMSMV